MAERRIIAVVGATGAQGGGLVRSVLADRNGGFTVRALTRKPDADKARELASRGAEVVAADIDDERSLVNALRGAQAGFFLTNFWEHLSADKELVQARNLARAAKAAGLAHVIWSTLEDTRRFIPLRDDRMPTLQGRYKVPHFDAKGEADALFTDAGVPTTFLLTSFYWENLIYFGMAPKRAADGKLDFALAMGERKLPGIASEDIGRCAYGIFKGGQRHIGRRIGIAGEHLTGAEMAAKLGAALGEPVRYQAITPAQLRAFGFPGADDLGNMFQFNQDFADAFCDARDPAVARDLNPRMQTFAAWLAENARRIPLQ